VTVPALRRHHRPVEGIAPELGHGAREERAGKARGRRAGGRSAPRAHPQR
jgi:hypothetical protein